MKDERELELSELITAEAETAGTHVYMRDAGPVRIMDVAEVHEAIVLTGDDAELFHRRVNSLWELSGYTTVSACAKFLSIIYTATLWH